MNELIVAKVFRYILLILGTILTFLHIAGFVYFFILDARYAGDPYAINVAIFPMLGAGMLCLLGWLAIGTTLLVLGLVFEKIKKNKILLVLYYGIPLLVFLAFNFLPIELVSDGLSA